MKLHARKREETGSRAARRLRREGLVPGVVYGLQKESTAVAVELKALMEALASGEPILELQMNGGTEPVIVKELQHHPVTERIIHVDFERVAMDETVTVKVPVTTKGIAAGVEDGGTLDLVIKELEIECLPQQIPDHIEIDVTSMAIGDTYKVGDLRLPEGIRVLEDEEEVVAVVVPPEEETEETAETTGEGEAAEPEVITKKKEAPEEAEGES